MPEREFALLEEAKEIRTYIRELELLTDACICHIKDRLDAYSLRELRCMHSDHILTQEEYEAAVLKVATKEDKA